MEFCEVESRHAVEFLARLCGFSLFFGFLFQVVLLGLGGGCGVGVFLPAVGILEITVVVVLDLGQFGTFEVVGRGEGPL